MSYSVRTYETDRWHWEVLTGDGERNSTSEAATDGYDSEDDAREAGETALAAAQHHVFRGEDGWRRIGPDGLVDEIYDDQHAAARAAEAELE